MTRYAVELEDAEGSLGKWVAEVGSGAEVVLTREGKAVARIVPPEAADEPKERVPGSAKGLFVVPDDFDEPLEDFRDYE